MRFDEDRFQIRVGINWIRIGRRFEREVILVERKMTKKKAKEIENIYQDNCGRV